MLATRCRRRYAVIGALTALLAIPLPAAAAPASPTASPAGPAGPAGPVSPVPASGTPELRPVEGFQQVRELKQCGGKMYAVGSFHAVISGGVTYARHNIFSFSATAPYRLTGWAPYVNGEVNAIAFDGSNCSRAYIGGHFNRVDGTAAKDVAAISTVRQAVEKGFAHRANGEVDTMAVNGDHLLVGGAFTWINGTPRDYYASLNLKTGQDDGYLHLDIHGTYQYPGVKPAHPYVFSQQVSHAGRRVLAEGEFTSVLGQPRQQIFMLFLAPGAATLTGWTSPEFSGHCVSGEPYYIRAAAWSPDDKTVYTAADGGHPYGWNGSFPLTGLCDTAASFSATEASQQPAWVAYTGCDSLYSVAADDAAVYVGGHQRWAENRDACNRAGPGAIADPGLQALSPGTGKLELDASGRPPYSMSRANADDMLITSAGLWIASTNRFRDQQCGGINGHSGICFLPY